jgi:hypothetical protein
MSGLTPEDIHLHTNGTRSLNTNSRILSAINKMLRHLLYRITTLNAIWGLGKPTSQEIVYRTHPQRSKTPAAVQSKRQPMCSHFCPLLRDLAAVHIATTQFIRKPRFAPSLFTRLGSRGKESCKLGLTRCTGLCASTKTINKTSMNFGHFFLVLKLHKNIMFLAQHCCFKFKPIQLDRISKLIISVAIYTVTIPI